jgi:acyl-CoA thioester hydrolase
LPVVSNANSTNPDPGWRFCYKAEVRFADVDMFGHVNNAVYLTYVESARVAYYTAVTGLSEPREFGMTLAGAKLDFLKPIFFGQSIHVYTRIERIGNKSWTLEYELRDAETGALMATASTVNVYYNYKTGQSERIPAEIIEQMEQFEGRKLK